MTRPILEVCVSSPDNGVLAVELGADRLELCAALQLGGITPHISLLNFLKKTGVPLGVLIRCRPGHFIYTNSEKELMLDQASGFFDAGADFLVMGGLTETKNLDCDFLDRLGKQFDTRKLVFHRAFDQVPNPFEAIDELAARGFLRILTNGQGDRVADPFKRLKDLVNKAQSRIGILPAGGIRAYNGSMILGKSGAKELHTSCLMEFEYLEIGFGYVEQLDANALKELRHSVDFPHPRGWKMATSPQETNPIESK